MKKVSYSLFIFLILASCNSVKRVPEKEHLLRATTILVDGKKNKNSELLDYVLQKPNARTLGIPISLYFHNLGNPNSPKTPKAWATLHPKKYAFFKSLFSEKQSIGVAKSYINFNNWFLNSGESPVIINDLKTSKTVTNLNSYYITQGYFKNKVTAKKDTLKKKKAKITYIINRGKPFYLDTIIRQIPSSVLKAIYQRDTISTFLKTGDQYNDQNFIKEAARITELFRNSGVYNFIDNAIRFYPDSTRTDNKTNVLVTIADKYLTDEDGRNVYKPFQIKKIGKINVYTDYTFNTESEPYLDSVTYNGINFFAHQKIKYNPKYLSQSIFIKPNQIYSDTLRNLTRNHLKSLKNFKSINIKYTEVNDSDLLIADIRLTPNEKYTIGTDTELTHSNIRKLGVSEKFSITNRNTFKGAELFKFSFIGSFFNTSTQFSNSNGFFNAWEVGVDASLEIPRFFAPFGLNRLVPKEMSPRTILSVGTGVQKNIGLDKQTVTAVIDFKWDFNSRKSINLELFNIQYIRNLNTSEYFNIYDSEFEKLKPVAMAYDPNFVLSKENAVNFMNTVNSDSNFQANYPSEFNDNGNVNNRYNIITSNFIIPTIAYSYTYSNQLTYKDNNFSFFRVRVANSGNFVSLLSNQKNSAGVKTISNTPIAQYFKTDVEYKQFWDVSRNSVLGFRSFLGVVLAYGKSDIPFTKSYFAGGSNDIRAWKTYELGPGSSAPGLEYNVGNFKFLTSLEYRFDLISNLKGALFIDAGNIWELTDSKFVESKAKLNSLEALKQMAVGSGFGARYDFNFLVLRIDVGFKTHEPYLTGSKWFKNFNFNNAVYNIGINYPF
ncbi:translocation and assembly module lipoprotein TamL [Polaribacter gochangensis]|uniref:translocation and assembly module lipoprotein TamL n=1 Tax=Polaribacter gochangensis TaxID=3252903 RepID=UPI003904AC70